MIRVNCSNIIHTTITAAFLLTFAVMINGCGNEIVPTESLMDDAHPADAEAAPDVMKDIDTAPNDDNGSEATEVKTGEKFTISLPSNPTTGYNWNAEFDTAFLELIEQKYEPAPSDLVGSGGVETFVFLAHREGEVKVKMTYKRPWEDAGIDEHVTLISIHP